MKLFFYTLKDIGIERLFKRIIYKINNFIDELIFNKLKIDLFINLILKKNNNFKWENKLSRTKNDSLISYKENKKFFIVFKLINQKRKLEFPFKWNNKQWPRLWQFHLHYFNWLRNWLEKDIKNQENSIELETIDNLISDWIKSNHKSSFDGWHSYTTSIRIRNLLLFYSFHPEIVKEKYLSSIWDQLIWLDRHPESYLGGNHWLENLTALIFGSLFFKNKKSNKIFLKALKKLEKEIDIQILEDGGHEERSSSYHILIIDRLVEIACLIYIFKNLRIDWLEEKIKKMYFWILKVRSKDKLLPRFNDNMFQSSEDVDDILNFASSIINRNNFCENGIRYELIRKCNFKKNYEIKKDKDSFSNCEINDLKDTGWLIIKSGNFYLTFKYGQSSPKHLPGHGHSDALSFDLFFKNIPLIAETGTSIYENGLRRINERSLRSHNALQLGEIINKKNSKINWIEPVEIWDSFKAGRKSKLKQINFGKYAKNTFWVEASHDAYERINSEHKRKIIFKKIGSSQCCLKIIDSLNIIKLTAWRSWWHLGPEQEKKFLFSTIGYFQKKYNAKYKWEKTYYANSFNELIPRYSLCIEGFLPRGKYEFEVEINFLVKQTSQKYEVSCKDSIFIV